MSRIVLRTRVWKQSPMIATIFGGRALAEIPPDPGGLQVVGAVISTMIPRVPPGTLCAFLAGAVVAMGLTIFEYPDLNPILVPKRCVGGGFIAMGVILCFRAFFLMLGNLMQ